MTTARKPPPALVQAAAIVTTIIAVLTSCSSNTDTTAPTKLPPPSAGTPAATATPTPSLAPEAQVEAAVRHYFNVANDAVKSGDTTKLVLLSRSSCQCRSLVTGIQNMHTNGGLDSTGFHVTSVSVQEVIGDTAAAEARYVVPAYKVFDKQGHVTEEIQYSEGDDYISLVRSDSGWLFDSTYDLKAKLGT